MNSANEWRMVKLEDICAIEVGKTPARKNPLYWGPGHPWLSIRDMNQGAEIYYTRETITDAAVDEANMKLRPAGSVLFSFKLSIGKVAIAKIPLFTNEAIAALTPIDEGIIDRSYLAHFLRAVGPGLQGNRAVMGATLNKRSLGEIDIPLPPLVEQQRIAGILNATQRQFDLLGAKKTHLASLRTGIVDEVLDADDRETLPLKEVAEIQSGITKGRKVREGEILTETAYLAVSNVKDGYLDLETVKTIPVTEAEIKRFRLQAGDILLTEGGDPDKLGRGTVWRDETEPCLHQNHIFRVRLPEGSRFTPEVLMAMLSTKQARAYFFRSAKQTTGIASINKTQLSAVPVPILTSREITRLSEILTQIDTLSETIDERWKATEDLHHSLSTRAFAGQL